jgi:LEA14-like dessication related protein
MLRSATGGGRFLWILGCGWWLAACAGAFSHAEPPEVSLAGLAFDQPGLFEQRLRLDVRLRNPNDFALDVERVLFDLDVNGQGLGKAWTTDSFDVPALGEAVVPVTVVVPTSDLIERIMDFSMTQRLDYRLKGEVKLNNLAFATLPFEQSGNFALPKLPAPRPPRT